MAIHQKNIWVAAADGDLDTIRHLVQSQATSPNAPDPNTYTPMHAAASYAQIHVLEYLVAHGGDVNITDNDGDTPLYTVENIETARWLVQHGAIVDRTNNEGISPIEHLEEEFPDVAAYLRSLSSPSSTHSTAPPPSQHTQEIASEHLTTELMASVADIMQRAEAEGRDPEDELRQAVSRTVLQGVVTGFEISENADDSRRRPIDDTDTPSKRSRTE